MAILIAMVSVAGGQAAVAMSIGRTNVAHGPALETVADQQPAGPLRPFAAQPKSASIDSTSPSPAHSIRMKPSNPVASSPILTLPTDLTGASTAIPSSVLAAYVNAVTMADAANPRCQLKWQALAGVGFIESDNARLGGSATRGWNGIADPPILGPVLDGSHGFARIVDSDAGALDGNTAFDRAVGPMQFLPSTWAQYAVDGDHDGIANPEDISDATLAAADYLCATGTDLNQPKPLIRAVYAYNHSYAYVRAVLTVAAHYAHLNPSAFGLGRLPKDHGKQPIHHQHRRGRTQPTRQPTAPATTPPTPTVSPSATPTASSHPTPMPSTSVTPTASSSSPDPVASAPAGRPSPPRH